MGIEKRDSKGGNYVGGFLQMFDWNAKSRKKLFSSKSEVSEQSKQTKRCDGNLPMTRLAMTDVDENETGSTVRGSNDHSCASSLVDEDFYGTKAPGVVARLMGLDSLPKSTISEPYSTPLSTSFSLRYAHYQTSQEMELNNPRVMLEPIKKFHTETLPPKSAKSIPITRHKLLSPIKSANFIPPKDAAHIMEAASKILEPGPPYVSNKTKLPSVGSSSAPLRVRDLKAKAEAAQKPTKIFETSQRKVESSSVKNTRGNSMNKSWNGSVDAMPRTVVQDSDESSSSNGVKSKGKSISLALQAKANVQKRGGLTVNRVSQKEFCELSPNHLFKSQSTSSQKSTAAKKASTQDVASVLRQNNQKQNCIVDRGKVSLKGGKTPSGESSSTRQRSSSKVSSTSRVNTRKLSSEVRDDRPQALSSRKERVTSKKWSVDGSYHLGKNRPSRNSYQSRDITQRQSRWDQDSGGTGTDVVSFTFTAPMTRDFVQSRGEDEDTSKILSVGYQSKRSIVNSIGTSSSEFSSHVNNAKGGDALSTLLEQKLKELADKVEFSQQKSGTDSNDMVPCLEPSTSSSMHTVNTVGLEETRTYIGNISQARNLLDCQLPSPVSVFEHSSAESFSSSNSAESISSGGSKQCPSIHALEELDAYSLKTYLAVEPDAELSDSASSTSTGPVAKGKVTMLTSSNNANPRRWEYEYVKEILSDIELMFEDYAVGRTHGVVNPRLFYQLESNGGDISTLDQRIMFDCVSECLELRCKQYVGGGYRLFAKGISLVRRKDILAQEVYREISGWNANIGDSMIDDCVDKDMSNQYGKWLDFDVEVLELGTRIQSRILNSLIDEVVADILML